MRKIVPRQTYTTGTKTFVSFGDSGTFKSQDKHSCNSCTQKKWCVCVWMVFKWCAPILSKRFVKCSIPDSKQKSARQKKMALTEAIY